jgi:uncharacterized membrane protein
MRSVIAILVLSVFVPPAMAQSRGYSRGSMMRMMQQRQQQLQAMQKTAAEQQAKSLAAQQAAEQKHRDLHKQASAARREKEKSLREKAIARRKLDATSAKTRENPMAAPAKVIESGVTPSQKPVAIDGAKSP